MNKTLCEVSGDDKDNDNGCDDDDHNDNRRDTVIDDKQ